MQAKLPADKKKKTIGDMEVGESGYSVPWAIKINKNMVAWLDADYTIRNQKSGAADTKITKEAEGYAVEVPTSERFTPQVLAELNLVPITKLAWV